MNLRVLASVDVIFIFEINLWFREFIQKKEIQWQILCQVGNIIMDLQKKCVCC